MSDTVGLVIIALCAVVFMGPIFLLMALDAWAAAKEMWSELFDRWRSS